MLRFQGDLVFHFFTSKKFWIQPFEVAKPPVLFRTLHRIYILVETWVAYVVAGFSPRLSAHSLVHVGRAAFCQQFWPFHLHHLKLGFGSEDALLKAHHSQAVLEFSDLWRNMDAALQL